MKYNGQNYLINKHPDPKYNVQNTNYSLNDEFANRNTRSTSTSISLNEASSPPPPQASDSEILFHPQEKSSKT